MPAYWIARAKIYNAENYKKYTDRVPPILDKFGGKVLSRGGDFSIMEGPGDWMRFALVEFPTMEDAIACFESDEYKEAAAFRRDGSGEVENVIVDGTPGHGNN